MSSPGSDPPGPPGTPESPAAAGAAGAAGPEGARVAFWRERVAQLGATAFVGEELLRLPVWPQGEDARRAVAGRLRRLRGRPEELAWLCAALEDSDVRLGAAREVPDLLARLRRRRMEQRRAPRPRPVAPAPEPGGGGDTPTRPPERPVSPGFLGRGVSGGLRFEGGVPERLAGQGLPVLERAEDIASAIGIDTRELAWLTYHRGAAATDHYFRFTRPKRSGGVRVISSPKARLRVAQQWLLDAVLAPLGVHPAAAAFRPGRSIVDNARRHAGGRVVVRLDYRDFFGTVVFRRVKGLFRSLGYNEGIATVLALLSTEAPRAPARLAPGGEAQFVSLGERRLPQGACTSPAITNVLCRRLDARLEGVARSLGFAYTRYADDLVFSHPAAAAPVGRLLSAARRVSAGEGFVVQESKTRVMRSQHRQVVTGLVVNAVDVVSAVDAADAARGGPDPPGAPGFSSTSVAPGDPAPVRVPRASRRRFRAMLHRCETEGLPAVSARLGQDALFYAVGYLGYIAMVDRGAGRRLREVHPWVRRPAGGAPS